MENTIQNTTKRDILLEKWLTAKETLAVAKETEMQLRKDLTALCFEAANTGTNRIDLGNGYSLKYVRSLAYSVDGAKIEDALEAIEKTGNEGQFIAERLCKIEYKVSVSEYKKLDAANPTHKKIKDLFDAVLTTKDSSPVLEFEEPKAKK